MNTYYNRFIEKHGEKHFLILYSIIFAIILVSITFATITFILGEEILIDRLPIFYLGSLGLGYATGRSILKRQKL